MVKSDEYGGCPNTGSFFWGQKCSAERCIVMIHNSLVWPKIWSFFDECSPIKVPELEGRVIC